VVCSVTEARDFSFSGVEQAKEPVLLEVAVGPALVVDSTAASFQTPPLSQDGAQSHANPSIASTQFAGFGVFEVAEPAGPCPVEVRHDAVASGGKKALPVFSSFSGNSDRIFGGLRLRLSLGCLFVTGVLIINRRRLLHR
jgi:hypothetical protein